MSMITTTILAGALALTVAACSAGGLPTPGPSAGGAGETGVPATTPTARPTEVPGPPAAWLAGGRDGPVAGELGTFYWGGLGSDSPWIVPQSAVTAAPGATLTVSLDPALAPERWTASWSPIRNGRAGDITTSTDGAWNPVQFEVPAQGGPWGAAVELHFPSGGVGGLLLEDRRGAVAGERLRSPGS